jgi:hypothetical protein
MLDRVHTKQAPCRDFVQIAGQRGVSADPVGTKRSRPSQDAMQAEKEQRGPAGARSR